MKRWVLYAGSSVAAAILVTACIVVLRPVPPFKFMEGYEWHEGPKLDGERTFVMTGVWFRVSDAAETELHGQGFQPAPSGSFIFTRAFARPPFDPRIPRVKLADVRLTAEFKDLDELFAKKPLPISIRVSDRVATRTLWQRLAALIGL